MTNTQRGIIALIRSTICEEARPLPSDFSLEEALPIIENHQIVTLVYDGVLRCGIDKSLPAVEKLFTKYCQNLIISEQQLQHFEEISTVFAKNGIDYLPLKGCVLKALYPRPELRVMTDADILIRQEQYQSVRPMMRSLGYEEQEETDHELQWTKGGHLVELHKCLIPAYNKDYYAYFGDGWSRANPAATPHRYEYSKEDTFIFLFAHFAKHYRDCGIGCRHMTDLWVCRNTWRDMDEAYIEEELKKLLLLGFYKNVLRTLDVWFADADSDDVTDLITETIFRSGSYGDFSQKMLALGMKETNLTGRSGDIKKLHWFHAVFCPLRVMEMRYPVLKKVPALLPAFWGVRIVETVLFHRERIEGVRQDAQSMSAEAIDAYRDGLNKVGLDYHFK